jgi:hypothetical protein
VNSRFRPVSRLTLVYMLRPIYSHLFYILEFWWDFYYSDEWIILKEIKSRVSCISLNSTIWKSIESLKRSEYYCLWLCNWSHSSLLSQRTCNLSVWCLFSVMTSLFTLLVWYCIHETSRWWMYSKCGFGEWKRRLWCISFRSDISEFFNGKTCMFINIVYADLLKYLLCI